MRRRSDEYFATRERMAALLIKLYHEKDSRLDIDSMLKEAFDAGYAYVYRKQSTVRWFKNCCDAHHIKVVKKEVVG